MNVRDVALRMARAFEKLGFFIFEGEELELVQRALEEAKLHETLKVVRLGEVSLKLKNLELETSYYMVTLDLESCLSSCKGDNECLKKCVEERKTAISRSLAEVKGEERPSDLSALLKRLREGS